MTYASPILRVEHLSVSYRRGGRPFPVVREVSLLLRAGQMLGLAGESGSGKSTTGLACVGYRAPNVHQIDGRVMFGDVDLLALDRKKVRRLWGRHVSYLPQDAALSLTPSAKVGSLFDETLRQHFALSRRERLTLIEDILARVGLGEVEGALDRYPFEFSGGQQQRLALALGLVCKPSVLILDEPTTGVDVTTQAIISALIKELVQELEIAVLYVSHDLALLHSVCDRIAVMYAGEIVETAPAAAIWNTPQHPYTAGLLNSVPDVGAPRRLLPIPGRPPVGAVEGRCSFGERCVHHLAACDVQILLRPIGTDHEARCIRADELPPLRAAGEARAAPNTEHEKPITVLTTNSLVCWYGDRRQQPVVRDAHLEIAAGEILALAGESGSGKSTLLRTIIGLHTHASGQMYHLGKPLPIGLSGRDSAVRRAIQLVPQHSASSLNPRHTVGAILKRPINIFFAGESRTAQEERLEQALEWVHLSRTHLARYPHELSGGQQQRVALARALIVEPSLVLCDEVVSALDVSVQAAILELILSLRDTTGAAFVFVTHDLAVVRAVADHVIVMQHGDLVERGDVESLFTRPQHDYTRRLLGAARTMHNNQDLEPAMVGRTHD